MEKQELTDLVRKWITQERVNTAKSALLAKTTIGESYSFDELQLRIAPHLGIEFVDEKGNINPKKLSSYKMIYSLIKGVEFITYLVAQRLAYERVFNIMENEKDVRYVRIGHA